MGAKIYVGGLPYSATEQELSDLFGRHGAVASARIIRISLRSDAVGWFGFVEMSSDAEAQAAITALNGSEWVADLTVNEARPQEPRTGGGGWIRWGWS